MKHVECLMTVAVIALAQPSAAELVVLESNAPRYTAGQTLASNAAISLGSGESLVIVTDDSRIVRVAGPHDGPAAGAPPQESAVRKAIDRLVSPDQPRVGGIGAVRGDDAAAAAVDTRPEPWLLHAERGGEQCALRGRPLELWRESTSQAAAARITAAEGDASAVARWAEGSARATWPEDELAVTDHRIYLVRFEGATRSAAVRVMLLEPAAAADPLAAAAWLAAKGCVAQARLALR